MHRLYPPLLVALFVLGGLSIPSTGFARCWIEHGMRSNTVDFGTVSVYADQPIGTVLASRDTGPYYNGDHIAGCNHDYTELHYHVNGVRTGVDGVWSTSMPGLGVRVTHLDYGKTFDFEYRKTGGGKVYSTITIGLRAELIKTGPIAGGTVPRTTLTRSKIEGEDDFAELNMAATVVQSTSCILDTPHLSVPLGDQPSSIFQGPGSASEPVRFDIALSCDRTANISLSMNGVTPPADANNGVLSLTGDSTARGVGVQILHQDGRPFPLGPTVDVGESGYDGAVTLFPFRARYYQTAPGVSGGTANATANFTINYH